MALQHKPQARGAGNPRDLTAEVASGKPTPHVRFYYSVGPGGSTLCAAGPFGTRDQSALCAAGPSFFPTLRGWLSGRWSRRCRCPLGVPSLARVPLGLELFEQGAVVASQRWPRADLVGAGSAGPQADSSGKEEPPRRTASPVIYVVELLCVLADGVDDEAAPLIHEAVAFVPTTRTLRCRGRQCRRSRQRRRHSVRPRHPAA